MKIMRQRSMSWLLVRLFRTITVFIKLKSDLTVILAILLLKKSTKLLANLGKYLHYGKNDIQIDISTKDQAKFFKTQDYFSMTALSCWWRTTLLRVPIGEFSAASSCFSSSSLPGGQTGHTTAASRYS